MGTRRSVPDRFGHWVRLRPDAIRSEPPPASSEFESDPPRDSREVLGLEVSIPRGAPPGAASPREFGKGPNDPKTPRRTTVGPGCLPGRYLRGSTTMSRSVLEDSPNLVEDSVRCWTKSSAVGSRPSWPSHAPQERQSLRGPELDVPLDDPPRASRCSGRRPGRVSPGGLAHLADTTGRRPKGPGEDHSPEAPKTAAR